jgi:hypothetical protein
MTAAIAVLALSDELKTHLLNLGVFDVLIPLTDSQSIEVQGNSAAALGNLSSKGMHYKTLIKQQALMSFQLATILFSFRTGQSRTEAFMAT